MINATIFGSGKMGSAIGDLLSATAASVQHVNEGDEATVTGDAVVLAVPYEALQDIAGQYEEQLQGRIVVDITNPLDFETFDALKVPAGRSAAAQLQGALRSELVDPAASRHAEANSTRNIAVVDGQGLPEDQLRALRAHHWVRNFYE